jgi:hypothetical protein
LKALTLTQPWAQLVALGAKGIETRSWKTDYRGDLAIHAAKGFPREAVLHCFEEPFRSVLQAAGIREPADLPLGAVIATAGLRDVLRITWGPAWNDGLEPSEESMYGQEPCCSQGEPECAGCTCASMFFPPWTTKQERAFGNYDDGRFAWLFEDVVALAEPIPAKGALGLWEWTPPDGVSGARSGESGVEGPALGGLPVSAQPPLDQYGARADPAPGAIP